MLKNEIVIQAILSKNADGILIKHHSNILYLTGYSGGDSYLFISKDGELSLYADGRYFERARKEANRNVNFVNIKEIYKDIVADIGNRLNRGKKCRILFESSYFTYEEYLGFKKAFKNSRLLPARNVLLKLRSVKTPEEVAKIKKAVSIAESSFADALKKFREHNDGHNDGMDETNLANLYKINLLNRSAFESFETIILAGERSAMPHGIPSGKKAGNKGILLCDFGAQLDFYKSDETVTLFFGKPEEKFRDIYNTVYTAQQIAISAVKPGIRFKKLDKLARDYIEKKGYGKYFTHSLGHGVGLDIHEYPYVSYKNDEPVLEGMVFTIEPGIYIPGYAGVRLEDMCIVKNAGCELLTNIKKDDLNYKWLLKRK